MNDTNQGEIGMLIKSNQEIKSTQVETNKILNRFIEVSIRNEERQERTHEALERLGSRVDKFEDKFAVLWDRVTKNSLIVNGAVAVVTAMVIWFAKGAIGG